VFLSVRWFGFYPIGWKIMKHKLKPERILRDLAITISFAGAITSWFKTGKMFMIWLWLLTFGLIAIVNSLYSMHKAYVRRWRSFASHTKEFITIDDSSLTTFNTVADMVAIGNDGEETELAKYGAEVYWKVVINSEATQDGANVYAILYNGDKWRAYSVNATKIKYLSERFKQRLDVTITQMLDRDVL
jgi:hypothetical protein